MSEEYSVDENAACICVPSEMEAIKVILHAMSDGDPQELTKLLMNDFTDEALAKGRHCTTCGVAVFESPNATMQRELLEARGVDVHYACFACTSVRLKYLVESGHLDEHNLMEMDTGDLLSDERKGEITALVTKPD